MAGHLLLNKQWKKILHWKWLASALLILLFITPELYSLWYQFDSHPEKVVFGKQNVSGIHFFFRDSQFGRFFNNGPIKGKGEPTFFLHTLLWAFLPWSVLLYAAIINRFKKSNLSILENYTLFGSLITFLIFSLSKFQLPHYINIIFPFFAIIAAHYLLRLKKLKGWIIFQLVLLCTLCLGVIAIHILYSPAVSSIAFLVLSVATIFLYIYFRKQLKAFALMRFLFIGSITSLLVNFYLNTIFYPDLLKYQAGSASATMLNSLGITSPVYVKGEGTSYSFDYYYNGPVIYIDSIDGSRSIKGLYLASEKEKLKTDSLKISYQIKQQYLNYPISKIKGKFINHTTRDSTLQHYYLLDIQ